MSADLAIGVSIVTFHSDVHLLERTLSAVDRQTLAPRWVRLHVNEAVDDEVTAIDLVLPARTQRSSSRTNEGFAGAHNALATDLFEAGATHVLVLNPDLVLAPDALEQLARFSLERPGGLVGPLLVLTDPATGASEGRIDSAGIVWTSSGRHLDGSQGEPLATAPTSARAVRGISGACLLLDRAGYDRLTAVSGELFDADFVAYREDAELAYRAELLGMRSWLVPAAVGYHVRRLRGTTRDMPAQVNLLGVRNRLLIAAKYRRRRPGGAVAPWLRDVVVLAAVVARERSSWPGVREAWRLRQHMRAKGRRVLDAAGSRRG